MMRRVRQLVSVRDMGLLHARYLRKTFLLVMVMTCTLLLTRTEVKKDLPIRPANVANEADGFLSMLLPECRKQQKKYTYKKEQDLLIMPKLEFIEDFKNPCWDDDSGHLHCLPYMYIVGMAKCGTSDMFKRITLHPEFVAPTDKEPSWLSSRRFNEKLTLVNYTDEYFKPLAEELKTTLDDKMRQVFITGEASVNTMEGSQYWELYGPNVNQSEPVVNNAEYIYHLTPQARILINIRNPVDRLWSEYLAFSKDLEKSAEKFHGIAKDEIGLYSQCMGGRSLRSCLYDTTLAKYASMDDTARTMFMTCHKRTQRDIVMLRRGVYHVYINDFLKVFPKEQVLIQRLEDISKDTRGALIRTYDFLGMRPLDNSTLDRILDMGVRNSRSPVDRNVGSMLPETRDMLWQFYRPFNTDLANLLGNEIYNYGPS